MPDTTTTRRTAHTVRDLSEIPVSVWTTAQHNSRGQRTKRYLPASTAHPAKMLPEIVRHAVEAYTEPGDLVLDPMCGIGTTVVEAAHLGRNAIGVEYEQRWADIAQANADHARTQGAPGTTLVINADARNLPAVAPASALGTAALVITSPPYGASLHGQVRSTRESGEAGVKKYDYKYSKNKANLAHVGREELVDGFRAILAGCLPLLRPGGIVAVTARPWREHGELVDLPSEVLRAGVGAGLEPVERCLALLAGIRDGQLIARPSFFQLANIRTARANGIPQHLIAAEDVLIFRRPTGAPGEPERARPEAENSSRSANGHSAQDAADCAGAGS